MLMKLMIYLFTFNNLPVLHIFLTLTFSLTQAWFSSCFFSSKFDPQCSEFDAKWLFFTFI